MRVFLDTNVWFSAMATQGICEILVERLAQSHSTLTSNLIWTELSGLLVRKLHFSPEEITQAKSVLDELEWIADSDDPADDNDRRLLAAAIDLFVTGDKRVLEWKTAGPMRIVTPREAWITLFAPHLQH